MIIKSSNLLFTKYTIKRTMICDWCMKMFINEIVILYDERNLTILILISIYSVT